MYTISKDVSRLVLTIGPDYRCHRGGIGAVISEYRRNYKEFNFVPTYRVGSIFIRISIFLQSIFHFTKTLICNRDIKLIHIHGASYSSFYRKLVYILLGKMIFRKTIIYHIHGGGFMDFYFGGGELNKKIVYRVMNYVDCVICLSVIWEKFFSSNFNIKNLWVLNNVVPYPKREESKLKLKTEELTFLFLGKICVEKGIFDLIEVIDKNKFKFHGKLKVVIGGSGDIDKLHHSIKEAKLEDVVEYVGWITEDNKSAYFELCDAFILPSYTEGMPVSVIEAMSYAKPVIATAVGGIPEVILPFTNGLLFQPGDMIGLEAAIDYFIKNRDDLYLLGENSEKIAKQFMPNVVFSRLNEIYGKFVV